MPWRQSLVEQHRHRQQNQLWRNRKQLDSAQSVEVVREAKRFVNFCSNDYLGLAHHPDLIAAAQKATAAWGTGSGASHLICGHQASHHLLEQELAEFIGAEKALLCSTGYMANLAVPQSFLGRGDLLLQDRLNHASLLDSAKLCRAQFRRFQHRDCADAERLLTDSTANKAKRKLISTDAVFSMDGDIAPIQQLSDLAEKQSAVLLIDDAHGFGVIGNQGRGSYSHAGLAPNQQRLMLGTLGKAMGSFGAFIAGDSLYIDHLQQHARTYVYTTALPAPVAEASRAALRVLQKETWRQEKLAESIEYIRRGITELGLDLLPSATPIQPILLGDADCALKASKILERHNIWLSAIRPPTVPVGSCRLRITLSAEHSTAHLDQLLTGLTAVKTELL